jgi:hypothetical protein
LEHFWLRKETPRAQIECCNGAETFSTDTNYCQFPSSFTSPENANLHQSWRKMGEKKFGVFGTDWTLWIMRIKNFKIGKKKSSAHTWTLGVSTGMDISKTVIE